MPKSHPSGYGRHSDPALQIPRQGKFVDCKPAKPRRVKAQSTAFQPVLLSTEPVLPVPPEPVAMHPGSSRVFWHIGKVSVLAVLMLLVGLGCAWAVGPHVLAIEKNAASPAKVSLEIVEQQPIQTASLSIRNETESVAAVKPKPTVVKEEPVEDSVEENENPEMKEIAALENAANLAKLETAPTGGLAVSLPTQRCGTTVDFVSSPRSAAKLANQQDRLLFVLHVSGNFEDPNLT